MTRFEYNGMVLIALYGSDKAKNSVLIEHLVAHNVPHLAVKSSIAVSRADFDNVPDTVRAECGLPLQERKTGSTRFLFLEQSIKAS